MTTYDDLPLIPDVTENVKNQIGSTLTTVDATHFTASFDLSKIIPGNKKHRGYRPFLNDSHGKLIKYNLAVWYVDWTRSQVIFKNESPVELGYTLPLTITCWTYIGSDKPSMDSESTDMAAVAGVVVDPDTVWTITDSRDTGNQGGNGVIGENIRTLNTVVSAGRFETDINLRNNILSIQPGKYQMQIECASFKATSHYVYLKNYDTNTVISNTRGMISDNATASTNFVVDFKTLTYVNICHYIATGTRNSSLLGLAAGQASHKEIFAKVIIRKIA
jgi:hypothetical protein